MAPNNVDDRAVYVDSIELYNGFNLTKDLEMKLESVQNNRLMILDSMAMQIESLGRQLQRDSDPDTKLVQFFEQIRNEYYMKEDQFAQDVQKLTQNYNEQIWNQLNEYTKQFGQDRGYSFILGGTGDGNIMYAKSDNDITKDLVAYVNRKYNGVK